MDVVLVTVGVILVVMVFVDLINTLVVAHSGWSRWWLTTIVYTTSWRLIRSLGQQVSDRWRERLYGAYASISVLVLLMIWVLQQVVGFGLIWMGLGGVSGLVDWFDSLYFSGVVYFTLGFGEIVPVEVVPRLGALVEAFAGVLTTALVIGYLPSLYAAYSERERQLMMLDDGSDDRITPFNLLISRAPNGDATEAFEFFADWERWTAGVLETHTTFPMLALFRSKYPGQHWVTALGVVTDAALQCQIINGAERGSAYWLVRRSIRLFEELTAHQDVSEYEAIFAAAAKDGPPEGYAQLHQGLVDHGFDVVPLEESYERIRDLRAKYSPRMEFLIDTLDAPRGFWGHSIGFIPAHHVDRVELE